MRLITYLKYIYIKLLKIYDINYLYSDYLMFYILVVNDIHG